MPRNGLAVVPWERIGQDIIDAAARWIVEHGVTGHVPAIAAQFSQYGVTPARLSNWLGNSAPGWRARKLEAIAAHQAHRPPPVDVPKAELVNPIEAERKRLEELRILKERREALRDVAGEESLRGVLERLASATAERLPAPPPYVAPPKKVETVTRESLVLQLSDWHSYEIVSAERMRDFNEYNADIFGQRTKRIVDSAISIKTRMEKGHGWRFPRLVIGANGDFVSGTIHELERHTDAPNIIWAVYGCARVLAVAIRDLSAHFETVDVFCSPGNHGRLPDARRMQQKDPTRNWDTLIYLLARDSLKDCKNVRFYIPNSYSVAFEVEGWRFLQTHGHDIKQWNSLPFYGINRAVSNINALESARNQTVHYFLFAHFHNKTSLEHAAGEWFINGSLIGGTEFGLNALGRSDKPCQWLLGVHKEHGVSHRWPLSGLAAVDAPGYEVAPWEAA